jgi:hypothetical protein
MAQIKDALDQGMYPLIVAEGTSEQKKEKLNKSAYLLRGLKSIASISDALFVYGFSFSDNDEHILIKIQKGKINKLCIGLYGDPRTKHNKKIILRVQKIKEARHTSRPLEIILFDAESAKAWG